MPKSGEELEKLKTERKQNIVLAGLKVFCEKGYDGATVDDIAKKAECSHGLFYHYFKSKKEIFDAVIESAGVHSDKTVENICAENISSTEKLQKIIAYLFYNIDKDENFAYYFYFFISQKFYMSVNDVNTPLPPPNKKPLFAFIKEVFEEGVKNGEFIDNYSVNECLTLLHSVIQGATLNYILLPSEMKNEGRKPNIHLIVDLFKKKQEI